VSSTDPTRISDRMVTATRLGEAFEGETRAPAIDGVTIERELGRGGMGAVWLGRQTYLDRQVAVKALTLQGDEKFAARFRREARILAGLSHPHIVACHQAGMAPDGRPFLVMEFVDGPDLKRHLAAHGPLVPAEAARLVAEVADGLRHAHAQGIIHRDVKPENILLAKRPDGAWTAKLADLGLARTSQGVQGQAHDLTAAGQVIGTPATMAPEQFDNPDAVDHRADIYGLGCVLHNALTGAAAFSGASFAALVASKVHGPAPDPSSVRADLPRELSALCRRMLARDRDQRPTYEEIIAALRAPQMQARRSPMLLPIVGALVAAVVIAAVLVLRAGSAPTMPTAPAQPAAVAHIVPVAPVAPVAATSVVVPVPVPAKATPLGLPPLLQPTDLFRSEFTKRLADWNIADPLAWAVSEDVEGFPIAGTSGEIVRPLPGAPGSLSGVVVMPQQTKRVLVGVRDATGRTTSLLLLPFDPLIVSLIASSADGTQTDSQGSATQQDRRVAFTLRFAAGRLQAILPGAAVAAPLQIELPAPPVAVVLYADGERPALFEALRAEP